MKFGASIWPFRWDPPYDDGIRRVAASGFRATELIGWNLDLLKDYYTPDTIANLRGILDGEGLELSQFVSTPHDLSSEDAGKRAAAVEHWQRAVDVGAALGAGIINMVSSHAFGMRDGAEYPRIVAKPLVQTYAANVPRGKDWSRNFEDYVGALRECASICEAAGVMMSVEPHPGRYLANTDGALRLLEHVNSPAMGINLDPSHTFPVGDFPNVSVYRLGSKIIHCHVSDNDAVTNVHWRPGQGKIDWGQMLQALHDVGFDGVISVELEDVPGVSRGKRMVSAGGFANEDATQEFVDETVAGMRYLKGLCGDLGIPYED
jgi:sugar phosphate isomerase/epimerase